MAGREYSVVQRAWWVSQTARKLRGDHEAQVVAFYLMTGPPVNMAGLYYLPLPTMAHETGLPLEGALKGLRRACGDGFAHYDEDAELVWVVNLCREQVSDKLSAKDNRVKGILAAVEPYRKHRFYALFMDKYGESHSLNRVLGISPLEAPSEPLARPFEAKEQEQDQEQEQLKSARGPSPHIALMQRWAADSGVLDAGVLSSTTKELCRQIAAAYASADKSGTHGWEKPYAAFRADPFVQDKKLGLKHLLDHPQKFNGAKASGNKLYDHMERNT